MIIDNFGDKSNASSHNTVIILNNQNRQVFQSRVSLIEYTLDLTMPHVTKVPNTLNKL